jgi:hypothetical protein
MPRKEAGAKEGKVLIPFRELGFFGPPQKMRSIILSVKLSMS